MSKRLLDRGWTHATTRDSWDAGDLHVALGFSNNDDVIQRVDLVQVQILAAGLRAVLATVENVQPPA